ncbi:AbrB/MazE/SpoVT family DNA-binding domain-containing protein [Thermococcus sp.]|uniref:AbrB/MazE/SpoVT family DNA-binding domain-containing protein n=1 Tax=Thermococcus sp. TaxID=35749 RepID=UPI0026091B7F|nr:AbrB/MazE/SpoVT family DNA-binding domain-containing protein [Thermococcus sp.]
MKESKEPLAKFQAKMNKDGRVSLPKQIKDVLGLESDDYLKVIIRKIKAEKSEGIIYVYGQEFAILRVGIRGYVVIPQKVRRDLNLKPNDSVEIVILDYYPSTTDSSYISEIGIKYRELNGVGQ